MSYLVERLPVSNNGGNRRRDVGRSGIAGPAESSENQMKGWRMMVWSRPGPTPMTDMRAPESSSRRSM